MSQGRHVRPCLRHGKKGSKQGVGLVPRSPRAEARPLHPDPSSGMAIYHLSADIVRRSAGRTVTAAAAYRAGELIEDARTGLVFDYRPRSGVAHVEIVAPDSAPAWMRNRASLWNGVEAAEKRKDSQLARDITLALPHELNPQQRIDLLRGFVASAFVSQGMVADIAIHAPSKRDADARNHHAHLLLTMRAIDGESFGPKVTAWNDKALLEQWRAQWAEHVNRALEAAGENARVDHRSLAAQGIERVAQIHLGPAVVELAARGIGTDRGDVAQEIEAVNVALAEIGRQVAAPESRAAPEPEPALTTTPAAASISPALTLRQAAPEILRPNHHLTAQASPTRGGIFALLREAAREVWGKIQGVARPGTLAWSARQRRPAHS